MKNSEKQDLYKHFRFLLESNFPHVIFPESVPELPFVSLKTGNGTRERYSFTTYSLATSRRKVEEGMEALIEDIKGTLTNQPYSKIIIRSINFEEKDCFIHIIIRWAANIPEKQFYEILDKYVSKVFKLKVEGAPCKIIQ